MKSCKFGWMKTESTSYLPWSHYLINTSVCSYFYYPLGHRGFWWTGIYKHIYALINNT